MKKCVPVCPRTWMNGVRQVVSPCFLGMWLLCGIPLYGQNPSAHTQALIQDPALKTASISLIVMDVETGKTLDAHQADKSLSPASVLKVVTTSTALAVLGADYRFKTELQYDGKIDADGVLQGNLYLKGYGDPTLGDGTLLGTASYPELMQEWASIIQAQGIQSIAGKIIGDGTYFAQQSTPASWQWNDIGNYYGAGVSGLNIAANSYTLTFQQNPKTGEQPQFIGTEPQLFNTQFVNQVTSAGKNSGDQCYIYGAPLQNLRFLRGTIPAGTGQFQVKGSLPEPAFSAAALLWQALRKSGVECPGGASSMFLETLSSTPPYASRVTFHTQHSPSLWDIAQKANGESINLYCEAMLRALGRAKKGEGSWEKGVETIKEYWKDRGVSMDGFFMEDGCGLSVRNGITARQTASILRKVQVDESLSFKFMESLPVGGKTGTLKWMFKGTQAEGRVMAKTGSMDRIRSYAGYVRTKSGRLLSFCVITNQFHAPNSTIRQKLERWMVALINI